MAKEKGKKIIKTILIVVLCIIIALGACVGIFFASYMPSLKLDFAKKTGAVTSGASGYLYGLAQENVPSEEMAESVDISTVSQKVIGGLQHPIGDVDDVYSTLPDSLEYVCVYLQDIYDTWYYDNDNIMQKRANGTYDWQAFLDEDYLPKVEKLTKELMNTSYSDKVIYCLYNECDNGVWFGETVSTDDENNEYGVYGDYNEVGRDNFNSAWKQTYDLVKSINPDAIIGGPGFCDYDSDEIEYFLNFCVQNYCVPNVMIYHELSSDSVYYWQSHVEDYRAIESKLGIDELEILVSEYGRMQDNGFPGEMVKYITQIETSKVYADNAYWRLSNNLNDVCADDNSPNSNWWLMRWYADMSGQTVENTYFDLFASDFERSIKAHKSLDTKGFMGIGAVTDSGDKIEIICGGTNNKAKISLKNLDATLLYGKTVEINIEETVYEGLYGVVSEPVTIKKYTTTLNKDMNIRLDELDSSNAYHIVITEADESAAPAYQNENLPVRYEFEDGKLLGNAYTYDSYCPASQSSKGDDMVGGMENEGDGVEITINVPADGKYTLNFVYGNSNDGEIDEETGRQNPDDRANTNALLTIDDDTQTLMFANTIKSEYTSCLSITSELTSGKHKIRVEHMEGTYVLDSLVVTPYSEDVSEIATLYDEDRSTDGVTSYLAVAPQDGYYSVVTTANTVLEISNATIKTDETGASLVYLKRGLNYIDINSYDAVISVIKSESEDTGAITLSPSSATLSGTAKLVTNDDGVDYIDSINCNGGSAEYTFKASKDGTYCVTMLYANNEEGGVHDYNVDLVERYISVAVNGDDVGNFYCRNTYSWQTFKTVTFNVNLKKGENTLTLTNNGANKFNNNDTSAPYISTITVNPAQAGT